MITILTYISIITGGLLIILMLISLIGGMDLDLDIGDGDVDMDSSGSLGIVKSFLTFVSVSTWVLKILAATSTSIWVAVVVALVSGLAALMLLTWIFKAMLRNQSNVNYSLDDSLFMEGKVYLKLPSDGNTGIIHVNIKGASREMKAVSTDGEEIETGAVVMVQEIIGDHVVVSRV